MTTPQQRTKAGLNRMMRVEKLLKDNENDQKRVR